jgi:ferredoxin-NADP reductase
MDDIIRVSAIENVTHDVKRFICEKPSGYSFNPGQATEVSINKPGWIEEKRPFTFTSLNEDPFLEFTIKIYNDHEGVTNELGKLKVNDELIIRDVWGAIEYKGPGYFIAGGAGITPFIAILRKLAKEDSAAGNMLFFSNKTAQDIILEKELTAILGERSVNIITDEKTDNYYNGFINEEFLKNNVTDFNKHFYLCGPPKMVESITATLIRLGAAPDAVVFEK